MDRRLQIAMDAADPRGLGRFWCEALGYVEEPPPAPYPDWPAALSGWGLPEERWNDAYVIVDPERVGPRIFIQKVPEGKSAKNRVHLDVGVPGHQSRDEPASPGEVRANVERLVDAGARVIQEYDQGPMGFWVVMADPEGNEFCACA
ncbi:MAG TPA: VOC family protein [Actinotalea sp.]|nr:VOC family protein [Actinotalea sp.]